MSKAVWSLQRSQTEPVEAPVALPEEVTAPGGGDRDGEHLRHFASIGAGPAVLDVPERSDRGESGERGESARAGEGEEAGEEEGGEGGGEGGGGGRGKTRHEGGQVG